jgi:hypothetical protein
LPSLSVSMAVMMHAHCGAVESGGERETGGLKIVRGALPHENNTQTRARRYCH